MKVILSTSGGTSNLRGTVTVTAAVTPASKVTRVEFYVDDVLKSPTDTSSPYTYSWDTTAVADGAHQLKARAFYPRFQIEEGKLDVSTDNEPTGPPPPPPSPPTNLTAPLISGTATEGMVLTLNRGTWSNEPTSYTQQWLRCDAAGANPVSIPGATGTSYALTSDDVGDTIRCVVIAYNMGASGSQASAPSTTAQTGVVAAAAGAVPTVDFDFEPFSPEVGETVTFTATTDGDTCHWDRTLDQVPEASLAPGTPFTYAYTSAGTKTMQLQTESAGGIKSSWIQKDIIVSAVAPPPPPSGTSLVYHNPETLTLQPWTRIECGTSSEPYATTNPFVSDVPTGITTPGIVRIVTDPLGQRGKVFELTTTTNSKFRTGSGDMFERVDLWQHNGVAWNVQGSEIWENFKIMFPNSWNPGTAGYYQWVYQHHNGSKVNVSGVGIVIGMREVAASYFFLRVPGGNVNGGPLPSTYNGPVAQRNHWYTIELHIKWSTGSDGFCNFYIDGALVYQTGFRATLGYNASYVDDPNYQLSNYHPALNANSTIYFDGPRIGRSRADASFT